MLRCSNIILSNGDPEYIPEGNDPVLAFIEAGQELTVLMTELSAHTASTTRPTTSPPR